MNWDEKPVEEEVPEGEISQASEVSGNSKFQVSGIESNCRELLAHWGKTTEAEVINHQLNAKCESQRPPKQHIKRLPSPVEGGRKG